MSNALDTAIANYLAAQELLAETKAAVAALLPADLPAATPVPTKVLDRSAWQTLRRTKGGVVRKAFAGLTREQAFEAGLCEGFHLPTGYVRNAVSAHKVA